MLQWGCAVFHNRSDLGCKVHDLLLDREQSTMALYSSDCLDVPHPVASGVCIIDHIGNVSLQDFVVL